MSCKVVLMDPIGGSSGGKRVKSSDDWTMMVVECNGLQICRLWNEETSVTECVTSAEQKTKRVAQSDWNGKTTARQGASQKECMEVRSRTEITKVQYNK
jgi:hypothetical protein